MNKRLERYTAIIKPRLARQLQEYQQPGTTITVTNIQISPDLKIAHVWISVYGAAANAVFEDVLKHQGTISKAVAAQNTAKFSPKLNFRRDEGLADTRHIESLLYNQDTD